jgi:hypothetical protein
MGSMKLGSMKPPFESGPNRILLAYVQKVVEVRLIRL